jgi:hypothetical protein
LENKDEDDDGSDSFGDEALEEGNRLLSSTSKDLFKDEANKKNVGKCIFYFFKKIFRGIFFGK